MAALAYGVEGLPAVDMIVGPGNLFVALAKKHVFGQVAIDCIAGPSEVVVLADDSAPPDYVAADLIAQAEHSPGRQHPGHLARAAARRRRRPPWKRSWPTLSRGDLARESLEQFGALVLARDAEEAVDLRQRSSPRSICTSDATTPRRCASDIDNAGAIFLGPYTPVAVGDYAAGPSHVLPTGGTARFASGLSANDFLRRTSVLSFTRDGLAQHGRRRAAAGRERRADRPRRERRRAHPRHERAAPRSPPRRRSRTQKSSGEPPETTSATGEPVL